MKPLRGLALVAVKAVHSLIFFSIEGSIFYLLFTGVRGRRDRSTLAAWAIVLGESAIYAGNRFRCPLTGLAENLGAESGSVTDIFLPRWLAANVANIHVPLVLIAALLHWRSSRTKEPAPAHPEALEG
jgi:hypothetical protein